jgi:hypothetical protein
MGILSFLSHIAGLDNEDGAAPNKQVNLGSTIADESYVSPGFN